MQIDTNATMPTYLNRKSRQKANWQFLIMFMTRASFKIAIESDTHIILIDMDDGRSLANDIVSVVSRLNQSLGKGIGNRRVYYRDTSGHFREIVVRNQQFSALSPCTESQQLKLAETLAGCY